MVSSGEATLDEERLLSRSTVVVSLDMCREHPQEHGYEIVNELAEDSPATR
jgi:hypothetical protein